VAFSRTRIKTWKRWHVRSCYSRNPEHAFAINTIWNNEVVHPLLRSNDGVLTIQLWVPTCYIRNNSTSFDSLSVTAPRINRHWRPNVMETFIVSFFFWKSVTLWQNTVNDEDKIIRKKYILNGAKTSYRSHPPRDCCHSRCSGFLRPVFDYLLPKFGRNLLSSSSGLWDNSRTHTTEHEDDTLLRNVGKHLPKHKARQARGHPQHEKRFESNKNLPALFHFQRVKRQISLCTIRILCYSIISSPSLAFVTEATEGISYYYYYHHHRHTYI